MAAGSAHRVLITGTFCSLNRGDAAMRIALIDAIREAVPDCHISLMTPYPEHDIGAYNCDTLVRCSRRKPPRVVSMLLRALLWNAARHLLKRDLTRVLDSELRKYHDSDIVVDLSGDGLTEDYGSKCLISHFVPIVLGKLLGTPVFVCAQSIGPFKRHKFLSRLILNSVQAISARERHTLTYLRDLKLRGPEVTLSADMAFLMKPAASDRISQIFTLEHIYSDGPLVGFSISSLPDVLAKSNFERSADMESELASTMDSLVELGMTPVLISHSVGPDARRDDRRVAVRVAGLMRHKNGAIVLRDRYSAEETKGVISRMNLMVGLRMHSCIASLSTGVPTIAIAYSHKASGIMSMAGQDRWVMHIRDLKAARLINLIGTAWDQRVEIMESLAVHVPEMIKMSTSNMDIISRVARRPATNARVVDKRASTGLQESGNVTSP